MSKNLDLKETIKASEIKHSIELLILGLREYRYSGSIKSKAYSVYQELDKAIEKIEDLDEELTYLMERPKIWEITEDD